MKLLTSLAPAVLIVGLMGCSNYGSAYEAEAACDKEAERVKQISNFNENESAWCKGEDGTNQFLLVNARFIENKGWRTGKVIKRFRY